MRSFNVREYDGVERRVSATGFIDEIGKPCRVFHVLLLVATVALKLSATGCKLPRH